MPTDEISLLRANLARETIKQAVSREYKIIFMDGGSSENIILGFKNLCADVFFAKNKEMGFGRRGGIKIAYDTMKAIIQWEIVFSIDVNYIHPKKQIELEEEKNRFP